MTLGLADMGVRAVLLDIEGTTTPIRFVHDVLFPYARTHLTAWFASAGDDSRRSIADSLRDEHAIDRRDGHDIPAWTDGAEETVASAERYVRWLMDRDRKSPALKRLQGLIWEQGYQSGELRGVVYSDVPPALRRWRAAGIAVAIYSSGSELAQRRLFESVGDDELPSLISRYFDTGVGPKLDASSYRRIAEALGVRPAELLFVSDVTAELGAARRAGCQPVLSIRPGNAPQDQEDDYVVVRSFDALV